MDVPVDLDRAYSRAEHVLEQEMRGVSMVVPTGTGVADIEESLFALNEAGTFVWRRLDGSTTLRNIARELAADFDVDETDACSDVATFMRELLLRGFAQ